LALIKWLAAEKRRVETGPERKYSTPIVLGSRYNVHHSQPNVYVTESTLFLLITLAKYIDEDVPSSNIGIGVCSIHEGYFSSSFTITNFMEFVVNIHLEIYYEI
jgi:hypothetical protein